MKKKIDVERFYDTEKYRPYYHNCMGMTQFIMTSDGDYGNIFLDD